MRGPGPRTRILALALGLAATLAGAPALADEGGAGRRPDLDDGAAARHRGRSWLLGRVRRRVEAARAPEDPEVLLVPSKRGNRPPHRLVRRERPRPPPLDAAGRRARIEAARSEGVVLERGQDEVFRVRARVTLPDGPGRAEWGLRFEDVLPRPVDDQKDLGRIRLVRFDSQDVWVAGGTLVSSVTLGHLRPEPGRLVLVVDVEVGRDLLRVRIDDQVMVEEGLYGRIPEVVRLRSMGYAGAEGTVLSSGVTPRR